MMEKPLAVSVEHAHAIAEAAHKSKIPVLVNFETTWYPAIMRRTTWSRESHRRDPQGGGP